MPDSYTPSGPDAVVMDKLRRMVALSPTFAARVGSVDVPADYNTCFARGYYRWVDDTASKPRFLIRSGGGVRWIFLAEGPGNFLFPVGTLALMLECDANPDMATENDQKLDAYDFMANVMSDVAALAGVDDPDNPTSHLDIREITPEEFGGEPPEITQASSGVTYWSIWSITWGIQGAG